ncbi:hypothetical protein [uncultured Roseibium sp.]|uniref:hypothetical protein n=1 Tax=uncultured Roseibium sp. TaxID=1936171 RepID=UPI003217D64C
MTDLSLNPAASHTASRSWIEKVGIGHVLLAFFLLIYPVMASDFFLTQIGGYSLVLGMIALSLMLLAGYGGMVSLAQITVAGAAGYVVAIFGENNSGVYGFGWPWWIYGPLAIMIASLLSALIGWIAVRTEGIYTIMITLAVADRVLLLRPAELRAVQRLPGLQRSEGAGGLRRLLARRGAVLLSVSRQCGRCLCRRPLRCAFDLRPDPAGDP